MVVRALVPEVGGWLLSETSKMPCKSWGLPAGHSCPFKVQAKTLFPGLQKPPGHTKDSPFVCDHCYAMRGFYQYAEYKKSSWRRYRWLLNCLKTPEGIDEFVNTMVSAIEQESMPFFRIHDSGDFFAPKYVTAWTMIVDRLPDTHFWAPTKSHYSPFAGLLVNLNTRPNIVVRPSADKLNDPPPMIPGFSAGTSTSLNAYTCPAPEQGNQCGTCRVCWMEPERPVIYHWH